MKKIGIILVIILILTLSLSVIACDNTKNSGTTNNNDGNETDTNNDGFISDKTTVEKLSEDLVKCLFNTVKTASLERINSNNPCVSWRIELDVVINDLKSLCVFEINYDNRDPSATEMKLEVTLEGESNPFVSLYFFQDAPIGDKTPGILYFQYGDAKVKVPVADTFLGSLFPISLKTEGNESLENFLIRIVSANIFTKGDIQYKYKNGVDGGCTRNYLFQVDLKATLINMLNLLNGSSGFEDMYESISWIIESLFGIERNKINSQFPDTIINVDVTTSGGSRTNLGRGAISNLKMDVSVAASDYKDSIFRGESYKIGLEMVEFKSSQKLIADFPKEDSNHFANYLSYSDTALVVNGALVYLDDEDTIYDITVGFRYDGLAETQHNDEIKIVVTEQNQPENKIVEFYAFDDMAYFNYYCVQGEWVTTEFPFDIDYFIEYMIEIGSAGDSFGFLKTVAYTLGSIKVWEDGSLSLNVDKEFYKGVLNLDIPTLVSGIEKSCTYAGGSMNTISSQFDKHNTDLATVLSELVINKEILLIFDNGEDSINTTNDLIDKSKFE